VEKRRRTKISQGPLFLMVPISPPISLLSAAPRRATHGGRKVHLVRGSAARILIQKIYYRNLSWTKRSGSRRQHRTCAKPMRCGTFGTRRRTRRTEHDPGRRRVLLHQPCSSGTLTAFGLRRYVTETISSTTFHLEFFLFSPTIILHTFSGLVFLPTNTMQ
jgi:hypothetical protein